jgi:hypothetical protein
MKQACIDLVGGLLGRPPVAKETAGLEDRVRLHMKLLARKDPDAWRALSLNERMTQAAQAAAQDLIAELQKQQQRVALTIQAHDKIEQFLANQGIKKPGDKLRALSQVLDFDTKGGGFTSAASWVKAIQEETFGQLIDTWTASHPKFFGLFEHQEGTRDLVREIFGEDTGNAAAKAGAKAWLKITDGLRDRYNAAGGDVGKLDEWHYPQSHSQQRIGKAGFERWAADTLPLLDRTKYVNEDGTSMNDGQMRDFLGAVYDSIITDGNNKRDTTRPQGYGLQANRGGEHRQVFFKDSASYLSYQGNYGDKSLWNVLTGHVRGLARDIGVAETLGPNPDQVFGAFNQRVLTEELRANPTKAAKLNKAAVFNDKLLDYVSGRQQVVDTELAAKFQGFRNFMTAAKLPKVIITALGDEAGMAATAFANKVPYSETFLREMATLNPANGRDRAMLEQNGIGLNSMMGGLNRFGQEEYGSGWTGKLANFVMHASGAERMWDARRQGLASILMSSLAKLTREHATFADLNLADHGVLANKGVTEADWQVWQKAEPELWQGETPMITPKSIQAIPDEAIAHLGDPTALRRHASTQLLAHVLEEAGMGAMDTGPRQRVTLQLGTTKGTYGGELLQSVLLFKSFAASMMMKHWARAAQMPGAGSKFGYIAPLIVYGTVIAALGNQIRNVLAGKDPANMASPAFWGAAVLRGGGLGFFGDFFYDEFTEQDTSLAAALTGPMGTTAEDIWKLTGAAAIHHARGQRTDEGGNLVRFGKQNLPVLSLWYLQAAMDHILWNQMQEAVSPGYLERMQAKAEAMKGTSWYWRPEDRVPERAPDVSLSKVFNTDRGMAETQRIASSVGLE